MITHEYFRQHWLHTDHEIWVRTDPESQKRSTESGIEVVRLSILAVITRIESSSGWSARFAEKKGTVIEDDSLLALMVRVDEALKRGPWMLKEEDNAGSS